MSRKSVIVSAGLGLVIVYAVVFLGPTSSEIDLHRRAAARLRFPQQPKSLADYLSPGYLLWNLQGRRSFSEVMKRRELHVDALVASGYLQRRSFTLEHQERNGNWSLPLENILRQNVRLQEPLASWSVLQISKQVTVTTRPDQMIIWEDLLRQFDLTNRPPIKPHASNRRRADQLRFARFGAAAVDDTDRCIDSGWATSVQTRVGVPRPLLVSVCFKFRDSSIYDE